LERCFGLRGLLLLLLLLLLLIPKLLVGHPRRLEKARSPAAAQTHGRGRLLLLLFWLRGGSLGAPEFLVRHPGRLEHSRPPPAASTHRAASRGLLLLLELLVRHPGGL